MIVLQYQAKMHNNIINSHTLLFVITKNWRMAAQETCLVFYPMQNGVYGSGEVKGSLASPYPRSSYDLWVRLSK
jgi:hypothetical protein